MEALHHNDIHHDDDDDDNSQVIHPTSSWMQLGKDTVVLADEHQHGDNSDDETASVTSEGSVSFISLASSESSSSSNSQNNNINHNHEESSSLERQQEEDEQTTSSLLLEVAKKKVFRTSSSSTTQNVIVVQTTTSLRKNKSRFRISSEELVERETRSDEQYKRRSMDLTASFLANFPEFFSEDMLVFDWDMPLFHEPLLLSNNSNNNNEERTTLNLLKSCMVSTGKNNNNTGAGISYSHHQKRVHWPSCLEDLCQVTSVVGYDESMIDDCFYNGSDFDDFRFDKLMEDCPDEYEWVSDDDEEEDEYDEISIEEEEEGESDDDEYYEEEAMEQPPMSRITSL